MNTHTDVTAPEPAPDRDHVAIWVALNQARLSLLRDVNKLLRDQDLPPLTWYDVLWSIEQQGGAARPAEIVKDLLFEPSALSHMAKRMAAAGLLTIDTATDDKRGRVLRLTSAGIEARRDIWKIYGKALEQRLNPLAQLSDPAAVAQALRKVSTPD
ncbi:MarR family transcriptional regulator [Epibacterium sp. SM1969]|uniref:MarR family transcriptional regulator n=1 Tax=Tritonibacter aquimaris TaxID=2663379 RepID=A0A844AMK4_9RHOB|nr:MarR family transcriptional regulator [Tritonibacter aquimaris]MQY41133.1 MarR family transcriptional regulator [Tritonibacter aquimaris]